jgi:hypothetical protein
MPPTPPAEFDRGCDIGRGDIVRALDIFRLVRIAGIGGDPVAQHEIGGLSLGRGIRRGEGQRAILVPFVTICNQNKSEESFAC